ncbi:MAG: ATP-dependent helicase [Pirellulales bacterium]|nr:ATP-dependent helicase [Pirellulales bacterium]
MAETPSVEQLLSGLNPQQRAAVTHGRGPLLIVAGAGTGKTATLVHRVAWLIAQGTEPGRILLLTFTRRAAAEMLRRADGVLREVAKTTGRGPSSRVWGGTFHAIATRLLRRHGRAIGLAEGFSVHDRGDSEDLMNVVRTGLGLAKTDRRFPKKGTCMAIYSRCVNSRSKLEPVLEKAFPWCRGWEDELKRLFDAYVDRKESLGVLDYDDLLLYWHALLGDETVGPRIREQFDCVLVDEYQDTNTLQAEIIHRLRPDGQGLTVVGDDAQSIYSFRAATVRNILDLPKRYPDTTLLTLEQNYRSREPILEAANHVIGQAKERFTKNLWSDRQGGGRPRLVACEDEDDQTAYVVRRILEHREEGIDLRRQAVLFRASHHSILLEAELTRREIPFHKYGGLKFIETAHIKDLLAFLRLAENPRDVVAGLRVLPLVPGIGPAKAHALMDMVGGSGEPFAAWKTWRPPEAARAAWPALVELMTSLAGPGKNAGLPEQVHRVRAFYSPLLEQVYDNPVPRSRDLEQLEQIASRYRGRRTMLTELTLDPPSSTQDLAGPPLLDDDYLILSTIHSAKGLEWDCVYVIHAVDGNIPSDMATGSPEEIEEELRLFYVALTRAKNWLDVCCPLRYYNYQRGTSDAHGYALPSRFISDNVAKFFDRVTPGSSLTEDDEPEKRQPPTGLTSETIRRRTKGLW